MPASSQVSIVLDPEFGSLLVDRLRGGPVWIIDTPTNRRAVEKHWAEHPGQSHLEGVTSFKGAPGASPEDIVINEMDTIDRHHGPHWAEIPYSVLEVIGASLTPRMEEALREYDFVAFEAIAEGFRASRLVGDTHLRD